mmetsp:Transcript_20378/g.28803  ORF Transcript_20378/g.28803 Transcript_20378/m.28803 type:complete len:969 (-) Transcript_20378:403-3309(-)
MGAGCKKMAPTTAADCMRMEKAVESEKDNMSRSDRHKNSTSSKQTSSNNTKVESDLGLDSSGKLLLEDEEDSNNSLETGGIAATTTNKQPSGSPSLLPKDTTADDVQGIVIEKSKITTNLKIWGCRGSIPRSEPNMIRYGGATSCVEFLSAKGTRVILDMGSGSYQLGQEMIQKFFGGNKGCSGGSILISHTHWDHIQGFPFFVPLFIPTQSWDVYGPRGAAGSIRESLAGQMQYDYFPINLDYLGANINYQDLNEGTFYLGNTSTKKDGDSNENKEETQSPPSLSTQEKNKNNATNDDPNDGDDDDENTKDSSTATTTTTAPMYCQEINNKKGDVRVSTHYLNHPCLTLGYRVTDTTTNVTVCYITDHEPYDHRMGKTGYKPSKPRTQPTADDKHVAFIAGADLLLHDAQYTAEQYTQKVTWGHSTVEYVVDVALAAGVKQLGLFHHDPMRTDDQVEELVDLAKERIAAAGSTLHVFATHDRQNIHLESHAEKNPNDQEGMSKRSSLSSTAADIVQSMWLKSEGSMADLLSSEEEGGALVGKDSGNSIPTKGSNHGGNKSMNGKIINDSGLTENHHTTETLLAEENDENGTAAAPSSDRIMLVFSDSSEAKPISQQLQNGHPVDIFNTSTEAIENAVTAKPALITIQKSIDGSISALDLCRKIRSEMGDWGRNVPILMQVASQQGLEDIRDVGQEVGVTDWLAKPYSPEYVRTKIRIAMLRTPCRWIKADLPEDESKRLDALRATKLLDTDPEDRFDRITRIASRAFDVPTVLVSLVDEHRQWFKSCQGLCASETHRDQAFCAHAILQEDVFVVPDALKDNRFADNPLVTGAPYVRFYAGVPLKVKNTNCKSTHGDSKSDDISKAINNIPNLKKTTNGDENENGKWRTCQSASPPRMRFLDNTQYHQVGTLCLIDTRPRTLDDEEMQALRDLGALVEQELQKTVEGTPSSLTTNNKSTENNSNARTA